MEMETIGLAAIGVLAGRPVLVWRRKLKLRRYWRSELLREPQKDCLRIVVLGDSISEGVGATDFQYSYVGRVGAYVAEKTGRSIFVANHAMAGATSDDVIRYQLPSVDIESADIIILEVGTNDGHKPRGKQENLAKNMKTLLALLPPDKTVVSDLPFPKLRKNYQAIMNEALKDTEAVRVYPSKVFKHIIPALSVTAGDFWHPNNRGHELWFEVFKPGVNEVLLRRKLLKTKQK